MAENKLFTIGSIFFLAAIYCSSLVSLFFGNSGGLVFFKIGPLALPALAMFLVICFLGIWKRRYFFIFLVFVLLAFPAPIDDLFPSVLLTNPDDRVPVVFPLITRIDLYLLLGILLKVLQKPHRLNSIKAPLVLKIFLLLFILVFLANAFKSRDLWDYNLLLAYSFHIRYFILSLLLIQLYDIKQYYKELLLGFVLSILFLFAEAYINTSIRGSGRLLSGSLSLNTFANISAAIGLYMLFLLKHRLIGRWLGIITLVVAVAIMFGSGTRAAFLTLVLAYFLIYLLENHKKVVVNSIKVLGGIFLLGAGYILASNNALIPERYSYQEITDKIEIDLSKGRLSKIIEVKGSEETTSIRSRIDLFESSLNMIKKNPLTGIGSGRWNRYKNQYHETKSISKVLLDTHNDYLALMSQYGIILGLLFAGLVFIYPFYLYRRIQFKAGNPLVHLYVLNFAMGIAALSNAGFFKHQVAALLILVICITIKLRTEDVQA